MFYLEDEREVPDSCPSGILIQDMAYSIVIQWSMTLCFIESQWNMPCPYENASRMGVRNLPINKNVPGYGNHKL